MDWGSCSSETGPYDVAMRSGNSAGARSRRAVVALVVTAGLLLSGCAAGATGGPTPAPGAQRTGDAELLRLIRPSFTGDARRVAVAVIDGGEVRRAFQDADPSTVFEIGSITKVFTGELLAEAIERGEVRADDEVGDHLDLGDSPIASATLRDLAAHRSGLPTFPTDPEWVEQAMADMEAGRDGVDENVEELLAEARGEALETEQEYAYSNMGAALLGQALAAAAGTDYPTLLADRLLDPLGLDGASVPLDDDDVSSGHAGGTNPEGEPAEPSTLGAYAPAGGIHATIDDLVTFASAVLDGPLADSAAHRDTIDLGDGSAIGYFWSVKEDRGHVIVSHNGVTGGFAAMMLIDRTADTASIVLSNRAEVVDDVGSTLLAHL